MGKGLKIVLVDDNTDYLFTMETFLNRNGFEVITSDDAEKGLAVIRSERPDVVLLDVMMETLFSGMVDELGIDYKQWPDYDYFKPDAFLDKPVDKQKLLRLIPETLEKVKKRKKRPKWKERMDKEWAEKASHSR